MSHTPTIAVIDRYPDGLPRVYLARCPACGQATATPHEGDAARWADRHPRVMRLLSDARMGDIDWGSAA